ncbi:hypothetical protein PAI11_03060 [Patulibacter medicamentivorans]|jgi:uracil-DNA glycosylase family 4|uniref:Uracil-DNA glycosylase-like domain-containing protein n=1 Tax=Patulibacter medicamentivorans TaxID=1097667 RepID=H0E0J8_9ACTN|nr:uracil-DNA glycosylase family protein [Patulibacter medicamentivorans]EHN12817.1 hypothetical protein PAI11_03060 [Patulibacter medicamentivorans]
MPATDDEIHEKYLDRAIREINSLTHDLHACERCPRGEALPVVGSGHPQADVFLLKQRATRAEIEEGVAFYGRGGAAVLKSLKRLGIDPTTIYGTLCVKCPVDEPSWAGDAGCIARVAEELAIVQPRIIVVMGADALATLNELDVPLAEPLREEPGVLQRFTPSCQVLMTPSIDDALDELHAKQAFWTAFRELGTWHDSLPPY